jgi:hypothetical protein
MPNPDKPEPKDKIEKASLATPAKVAKKILDYSLLWV